MAGRCYIIIYTHKTMDNVDREGKRYGKKQSSFTKGNSAGPVKGPSNAEKNTGFFQSIMGKILVMGITALVALVILGAVGILALNKNSNNNRVLTEMNEISVRQSENQSLETSYLYFLEDSYLENIVTNLDDMEQSAVSAKSAAGSGTAGKEISSMQSALEECRDNYVTIRELSTERGFTSEAGSYQKFLASDEELKTGFQAVADDKLWLDAQWVDVSTATETVDIDGKKFVHMPYSNPLPQNGKRDYFIPRIGGNGVDYSGTVYINNIVFHGSGEDKQFDLSAVTAEDLSGSYGDGLKEVSVGKAAGEDSLVVDAEFISAGDDGWKEISIKMPAASYDMQNYTSVSYDMYFEEGNCRVLSTEFALSDKYGFGSSLEKLNSDFASYSKSVVEGSDTSEKADAIRGLFAEISKNLDDYVVDDAQKQQLAKLTEDKLKTFEDMAEEDVQIYELKKENTELSAQLSSLTAEVRSNVEKNTSGTQRNLIVIIAVILLASAAVLVILTLYISRTMNSSIHIFKDTLSEMTGGNLAVRAEIRGRDEFSVFGKYVNDFLDRLSEVISSAQNISCAVKQSGEKLDTMAENSNQTSMEIGMAVEGISSGATTQAGETDSASGQIQQMGIAFEGIVQSIRHLGEMADQMHEVSSESARFMEELGQTNRKTVEVFSQVSRQTHTTNQSVQKIREAAELITSIADQTNLLSLNASIEAARAGEAGRGFAVVATEIQNLAVQSSESADIIKQIIEELAREADLTVKIVDEVTEIVETQQQKLTQTQEHFEVLEHGIEDSGKETDVIKEQTRICDEARRNVEEIITGLSAISEQNAASTQETTASMTEFNQNIENLVGASGELKEMANRLENDLNFFRTR